MKLMKLSALAITIAAFGLVACGKNKNNLKVDGEYMGTENPDGSMSLIEIKDNVQTTYTFNKDKTAVQVEKARLTIRKDKLISTEIIESSCDTSRVGAQQMGNDNLNKTGGGLSISHQQDGTISNLQAIKDDGLKQILADARDGKITRACLKEDGSVDEARTKAMQAAAQAQQEAKAAQQQEADEQNAEKGLQKSSDSATEADVAADAAAQAADAASDEDKDSKSAQNPTDKDAMDKSTLLPAP